MPMNLAHLKDKTKTGTFVYDGETLNYVVRYQRITPKLVAAIRNLANAADGGNTMDGIADIGLEASEQLVSLIASWDLMDGEIVYPLDVQRLQAEIPLVFQLQLLMHLVGDMGAGEATATTTSSVSNPASAAI